jgi:hypothetical protein
MNGEAQAFNVFYSCADTPEDRALCEQLERHLSILKRSGLIRDWHARNIQAGTEWERTAHAQLNNAQIILLLISADFIASDYCYSKEMRYALARQKTGEARVVPILLRPVDRRDTPFEHLAALPSNKKPITLWPNLDAAFADITAGIRYIIENWSVPQQSFSSRNPHVQELLPEAVPLHPTINTHAAIGLFQQLMRPDGNLRMLCLVGDGKMGKSHLLTKAFPSIAEREQVRYVILDLRNRLYDVPEVLKMICDLIGSELFKSYITTYQHWFSKSKSMCFKALFSPGKKCLALSHHTDLYLTQQFVSDIQCLCDKPFLLLCDSVNLASENIQQWLVDVLLVQLLQLPHVRVVVAGRSLPVVNGSYAALSARYQLRPVIEVDEFLAYCHKTELMLDESSIRNIAYGCDYIPGMFVDFVVPKFLKERSLHG